MMSSSLAWCTASGLWAVRSLAILLLSAVSCGGSVKATDTHVGREEAYRTGNFDYDEFFEDVASLQATAKNALAEEKSARAPLGQALGVGETSLEKLLETFQAKAEQLATNKSRVHLFFLGIDEQGRPLAGKKIAVTAISGSKQQVPKDAAHIAAALGQSAQGEGQIWEKYAPLPDKGRRLEAKAKELRQSLAADFAQTPKEKRNQIEQELNAAEQASGQIAEDCATVVAAALKFLKEGSEIVVAAATAELKTPAVTRPGKAKPVRSSTPPPAEHPPVRTVKPKEPSPKSGPASRESAGTNAPPKKQGTPVPRPTEPTEPAPKAPDFNP
jgi:hypothetical protein